MDGQGNQIRKLMEDTSRIRGQFLLAEIRTCSIALEVGDYELSVGSIDIAVRETKNVERGISALRRFLEGAPAEQREEIARKQADIEERLSRLKLLIAARIAELETQHSSERKTL